jgi:hypothetical protein
MKIQIQTQDELAIQAMSIELRSLLYYSLCSLSADISRADNTTPQPYNTPDIIEFRRVIQEHTTSHIEYIETLSQNICEPLSLINLMSAKG